MNLDKTRLPTIPPHLLGIFCVIAAMVIFSTQDMAIKWLSGGYPLHEIVFIRAAVAICVTLGVLVPLEGGFANLRSKRWKMHLLRGGAIVVGNMCFFTGLASLPLAEAVAIFFTAPLIITVLAVPILGERISWRRMTAVLVGLLGAVVIIRPGGAAFQMAALLPLVAALAYSCMQMMTRSLGMAEKASVMAFYIQLMFLLASSTFWLIAGDGRFAGSDDPSVEFLLRAWIWPSSGDMAIMVAIGFFNAFGGYLISQGYRVSEAGVVAPFEYVAIPLSVFWSLFLFGERPDFWAWLGIALICGAGLYVAFREARSFRR
jgi:drug/metabolite transporter (DMT)-like permease